MDRYIGKVLSQRYRIDELIGMGGMSNVYKAFDTKTGRIIAIKILRDEYLNNPELLKRFKNESKAIIVLSSPNIVNVYDVSFNEARPWIAMEYIYGITLKEYIKRKKILKWQEAVYFTEQILCALQHAHDKGIIHRDIKPQNIMLLKDGTVKVMDFGIAKFARDHTKTITDKAIGSVHYISPEQAKGGNIDERTDIYSVGVMLFEMITGHLPFDAENAVSVVLKQIQSQPLRPHQLNPDLPIGIDQIVIKSMQKNSQDRYQSAAEMLNDLMLLRKDPNKAFLHEDNFNMRNHNNMPFRANKIRPQNNIDKNYFRENVYSPKKESTSWIKTLMIISCIIFFITAAIVAGALFLSGIFSSTKNIRVPDLLGQNYEQAKDKLNSLKLEVQLSTTEYSENYAEGEICEQTPKAGRLAKENSIIMVKVSKGQKNIKMPNVIGKDIQSASAELKNLGINVKEVRVFDEKIEKDIIIKTEPEVNSDVLLGSEITVYVSDGNEIKTMKAPDLNLFNLESAKMMLENMKLKLGDVDSVNSDKPKNTVVRQSPRAGEEVEIGTAINIQVSSGVSDAKTFSLTVQLPTIEEEASLKALVDDEKVIKEEILNLSEVHSWKIQFTLKDIHKVQILINDNLFKEYEIDFNNGTKKLLQNNTNNF